MDFNTAQQYHVLVKMYCKAIYITKRVGNVFVSDETIAVGNVHSKEGHWV